MRLGIIGGVGPITGVDFLNKIILNTNASNDNAHIPIILFSLPSSIKSRTDAFFNNNIEPAINVIELIKILIALNVTHIAITCNTLHIPFFFERIRLYCINNKLYLYSLVEEVINYLQGEYKHSKFLLLSTKATYVSNLYQMCFEKNDKVIISISDNDIDNIDLIIKEFKANLNDHFNIFSKILRITLKYKFDSIIIGCTELSYLFSIYHYDNCIDPNYLLAKRIIFDYERN